jgi:glycosyltransferase involved in cell wall biosynthesis
MGIKYHLRIAGPFCDAAARDLLDRFTEDHSNCEWIGPVHASAKVLFFQTIDCLLFPSNYVNEAQPLVLLEAAASGVPWIASSIGSIPDLANQLEQKTAPAGTAFVQHAVRTIQTWALEPRSIAQAKQATAAAARRAAMESKKQWVALLDLVLERG